MVDGGVILGRAGDTVARRSLEFYDAVAHRLAQESRASATAELTPSMLDRIRHDLVGLRMPRALEALDHIVRRLEQGEIGALEAIDILLAEELTLRENSRIKTSAHGPPGDDQDPRRLRVLLPAFAQSDRILALAQLGFIARGEVVHFLGPPDSGS